MPFSDPEKKKAHASRSQRLAKFDGNSLDDPPKIKNPKLREDCRRDLRLFLLSYFPKVFTLKFSDSHEKLIVSAREAVLYERKFAFALPRGSGKTSIMRRALLWACLYGHWRFGIIVGADEGKSKKNLLAIKKEIMVNVRLREDFPEVVYPFLEGENPLRAQYQHYQGVPTYIGMSSQELAFPNWIWSEIQGNAGAKLGAGGITSAYIRGGLEMHPSGDEVRPDGVLVDDILTKKTARSRDMNREREEIVCGDILGMAGPDHAMSMLFAGTVIEPDDATDRITNVDLYPDFYGLKIPFFLKWPTNKQAHQLYEDIRKGLSPKRRKEYWLENQKELEEGAEVYWQERIIDSMAVSAVQTGTELWHQNKETFMSEYQNRPVLKDEVASELTKENVEAKIGPLNQKIVLAGYQRLVAAIDVSKKCLWWGVGAFTKPFGGQLCDYGVWPAQTRRYISLANIRRTLSIEYPGNSFEVTLTHGLNALIDWLLAQEFQIETGGVARIQAIVVDAGWGDYAKTVRTILRRHASASQLYASQGVGLTARQRAFNDTKTLPKEGETRFNDSRLYRNQQGQFITFDTNIFKTFVESRLLSDIADPSSFNIYAGEVKHHQWLIEQLTSEYGVFKGREDKTRRRIKEWVVRPNREEHLWDVVVLLHLLTHILGIPFPVTDTESIAPVIVERVPFGGQLKTPTKVEQASEIAQDSVIRIPFSGN